MTLSGKSSLCAVAAFVAGILFSTPVIAQETTTTTSTPKSATRVVTIDTAQVVYASGDDAVLKTPDGRVRLFDIPPGTSFTIDGKPATAADLTPGSTIAHVKMSTRVQADVTTVTQVNGTITAKNGPWVTLRLDDGTSKMYRVPSHATFSIDGRTAKYADVTKGMKISATAVKTEATTTQSSQAAMVGSTPPQSGTLLIEK
jgi:hypothetical protein